MKTGYELPNGAIYIAERGDVVLAKMEHSPQPWVTWRFRIGHYETTGAGRYHDNLQDAVESLYSRS